MFTILTDIFANKGVKRTVSSILAVAACAADAVPVLTPYKEVILYLAGLFGVTGVTHAVLGKGIK